MLNQQLQAQLAALQNNKAEIEGELKNNRSPNLLALDELIQKRIVEANSLDHPPPITKIHDFSLSLRGSKGVSSQGNSQLPLSTTTPK